MCFKTKLNAAVSRGVKEAYLDENGDLIFVMTDGQTLNLGHIKNAMVVHITQGEDGSYTADKTYEEICAAHENGSYVMAYNGVFFAPLTYKMEGKGVMFTSVYQPIFRDPNVYEMSSHAYMISSSDVVAVREDRFNFLPTVDAEDEDKIMAVSNGVWSLVPMPTVDEEQITEAVNTALTAAKESGELDGADGKDGSDYVLTDDDKAEIAAAVKASMTTEEWTFTLEDGSTVTKAVYVG